MSVFFPFDLKRGSGLRCNDDIIRGVNAGGWLVLEPWMSPSIFADFNNVASRI
jgi:glucan 1,3-beta-glucosidase